MSEEAQPSSPVAVNDGAEDVVEAELSASDAHHSHLVEGDFFPSEVAVVEGDGGGDGDGDEANVEQIAADAEAAVVEAAAASAASTPPQPVAPPSRKRVRWVDDGKAAAPAHGLVKHVTSFYMPHASRGSRSDLIDPSSPTRPSHAAAVNPAPSVFRDKANADGTTYKFCKAQRPALRFAEWKRQPHEYGATPFEVQLSTASDAGTTSGLSAVGDAPAPPARTLFGALYQRSVVTRLTEGQVRIRAGTHHRRYTDGFQLPFVRVSEPFDEPISIPLPPFGGQ